MRLGNFSDDECVRTDGVTVLCYPAFQLFSGKQLYALIFSMSTDIHAEVRGARCHHEQSAQAPIYRNLDCVCGRVASCVSVVPRETHLHYLCSCIPDTASMASRISTVILAV